MNNFEIGQFNSRFKDDGERVTILLKCYKCLVQLVTSQIKDFCTCYTNCEYAFGPTVSRVPTGLLQ